MYLEGNCHYRGMDNKWLWHLTLSSSVRLNPAKQSLELQLKGAGNSLDTIVFNQDHKELFDKKWRKVHVDVVGGTVRMNGVFLENVFTSSNTSKDQFARQGWTEFYRKLYWWLMSLFGKNEWKAHWLNRYWISGWQAEKR